MLTRFPGSLETSLRVPLPLHCSWVRPFDFAQGPPPTATATPPFQSGVGRLEKSLHGSILPGKKEKTFPEFVEGNIHKKTFVNNRGS